MRSPGYSSAFLFFLFITSCQSFKPDANTMRLHDIWGLKEVKGQVVNSLDRGVLEIYVQEQRFLFSSGNRNYSGKLHFGKDQQISFSQIQMESPQGEEADKHPFIQILPEVVRWEFNKLHLHLYSKDEVVARLVKMD